MPTHATASVEISNTAGKNMSIAYTRGTKRVSYTSCLHILCELGVAGYGDDVGIGRKVVGGRDLGVRV